MAINNYKYIFFAIEFQLSILPFSARICVFIIVPDFSYKHKKFNIFSAMKYAKFNIINLKKIFFLAMNSAHVIEWREKAFISNQSLANRLYIILCNEY